MFPNDMPITNKMCNFVTRRQRRKEMRHRILGRLVSGIAGIAVAASALWSCSSVKHVPDGHYLLDKVTIEVSGDSVDTDELYYFLRQTPNHKVLGFAKLQLATYSLSGRDSTKWYNRWLRKIGQPPVIYSPELTESSARQLRQALINKGYLDAKIKTDTTITKSKRLSLRYTIDPGRIRYISTVGYDIPDTAIRRIVMADTSALSLRYGAPFDRNSLDNDRSIITERLRNRGYYAFSKDNINFIADTAAGSQAVGLTLCVRPPKKIQAAYLPPADSLGTDDLRHLTYRISHVYFITDMNDNSPGPRDTVDYRTVSVIYGQDHYIRPSILEEKCYLRPGEVYRARNVDRTYEALGRLGILKFINIEMVPVSRIGDEVWLDAVIRLSKNRKQGITVELEGTNSEGDLGFGAGVTYQHRNLGKRSELLTAKLRGAYESLSGNFDGLINDHYTEIAGEVGITFPKFQAPFLSKSFKQRQRASTEFALSFEIGRAHV